MKNYMKRIYKTLIRPSLLVLIVFPLLIASCTDRKYKLDKENLIPEKDLLAILTDIHIADGLLSIPSINYRFSSLDSIRTYYQVIEKHGYTKEAMDKTMKYYFVNNPKELNKIYDRILVVLGEMQARAEKESKLLQTRLLNLWPGKEFYDEPTIRGNDSTQFNVKFAKPGTYTLKFSATLYPDDQSINPKASVYSVVSDSVETGKKHYIKCPEYLKDGRSHNYFISFRLTQERLTNFRGRLLENNNKPNEFLRHFKLENITITLSQVP